MTSEQEIQELVDHIESVNFISSGNDRLILNDRCINQPFRVEWKRDGVFVQFIDNGKLKRVKAEGTRVGDSPNAHYYLRTVNKDEEP